MMVARLSVNQLSAVAGVDVFGEEERAAAITVRLERS
jgi:hypothetical protein